MECAATNDLTDIHEITDNTCVYVFLKQYKLKKKRGKTTKDCCCLAQLQDIVSGLFYSHFIQTYSQAIQTEQKRARGKTHCNTESGVFYFNWGADFMVG